MEFAGDVHRHCIFASREYELFGNIFREMFAESPEPPEQMPFVTEDYPDGIPGIVLVKRTITVADVIAEPGVKTPRVQILKRVRKSIDSRRDSEAGLPAYRLRARLWGAGAHI